METTVPNVYQSVPSAGKVHMTLYTMCVSEYDSGVSHSLPVLSLYPIVSGLNI